MIGGLALGGAACHVHIGKGIVLDLHLVDIETEAEGDLEAIAQKDIRLVEGGKAP